MIRLVEMTNFLLVCAEGEETQIEMVARARRLLKELDIKFKVPAE
jgi:hypothetical protein